MAQSFIFLGDFSNFFLMCCLEANLVWGFMTIGLFFGVPFQTFSFSRTPNGEKKSPKIQM